MAIPLQGARRAACDWGGSIAPRWSVRLTHPLLLLAALLAALGPMWHWYARRMIDGSDEPWGVVALLTVVMLGCVHGRWIDARPDRTLLLAGGTTVLLSALAAFRLPPLACAAVAVSGVAFTLAAVLDRDRPLLPLWAMLLLSLPVLASLQFYAGYPMRALTAWVSQGVLRASGLEVERSGVVLSWMGRAVLVDAPCSGVHMLWVGMFLNALLSYLQRASAARFLLNTAATLVLVLAGNASRNTLLFVKEAGIVSLPAWTHAGIGVLAFLATAMAIAALVRGGAAGPREAPENTARAHSRPAATACFVALTVAAGLIPLLHAGETGARSRSAVAWPTTFQGRPLERVALTPVEERFAAHFPGAVARFTDGEHQLILRAIDRPTRLLHPAADCFKAVGYSVQDSGVMADANGVQWGCFTASRYGRSMRVCERIFDEDGHSWTDVSAWYWHAVLGRTRAPWTAVAVAGTQ